MSNEIYKLNDGKQYKILSYDSMSYKVFDKDFKFNLLNNKLKLPFNNLALMHDSSNDKLLLISVINEDRILFMFKTDDDNLNLVNTIKLSGVLKDFGNAYYYEIHNDKLIHLDKNFKIRTIPLNLLYSIN